MTDSVALGVVVDFGVVVELLGEISFMAAKPKPPTTSTARRMGTKNLNGDDFGGGVAAMLGFSNGGRGGGAASSGGVKTVVVSKTGDDKGSWGAAGVRSGRGWVSMPGS